jgi:cytochrome P450
MPLLMDGPEHENMRRRMAAFLAGRRMAIAARLPALVEQHFLPLRDTVEIDLAEACLLPFVRDMFSEMVEANSPIAFQRIAITRIFDRYIGLGTIKMVERELAELRASVTGACAAAVARGDEDMLVALLVLGRDSLLATLASSLYAILAAHSGERLDSIDFPDFPPETGVAIAERLVRESFNYNGSQFAAGDRVRLYLQSLNYDASPGVQKLIFGAGPHSCLGRHMSLDVWPAITGWLKSSPRAISGIECSYSDNQIFVMPERLVLRFMS